MTLQPSLIIIILIIASLTASMVIIYTTQSKNRHIPYCGDKKCNVNETCETCSTDCGKCSTLNVSREMPLDQFPCPFDCCIGEANYSNKSCSTGYECKERECVIMSVCYCPQPSTWSNCINNRQNRTNYRCSAETNYTCQAFIEIGDCVVTTLDPCAGVMCNFPPANICISSTTLKNYSQGTCIEGNCSYPSTDIICPSGQTCSDGRCTSVCTSNWSCTSWSPATSSYNCGTTFTQTRTCTDLNNCGTAAGLPAESQTVTGIYCPSGTCSGESCISVTPKVNIMAYIQSGVFGVSETSYRTFISDINNLYLVNGIDVNFSIGRIEWYSAGGSCESNFYGNDVIMCVGPGKGGFLGPPFFVVGANTNDPFGFSSTGIRAEAHELGHYLGFQDLYWLRSQEPLKAPTIPEVENDIMTDPYNSAAVFGEHAKSVISTNLERLKNYGNSTSILYPINRTASKLNISVGISNQECKVYTRERDYTQFNSRVNSNPSLTLTTSNYGNFEMSIIGGDPADNNFDIYYILCGSNSFWVSSLEMEECFIRYGAGAICNVKCLNNNTWCDFY